MTEEFKPKPYFDPNAPKVPQAIPEEKLQHSGFRANSQNLGFDYHTGDDAITVHSIYRDGYWEDEAIDTIPAGKEFTYAEFITACERYLVGINKQLED